MTVSSTMLSVPPKYPANAPTSAATAVDSTAPSKPITSDFCSPRIVSANMSKPVCVVPNQCVADGGDKNALASSSLYSQGVTNGPRYASANSSTSTASP